MASNALLPFHSVRPGASGVRFTRIDGRIYLSVRDFIIAVCNQTDNHARMTWSRLPCDVKNEVATFCCDFKFPGRGQQDQPVIRIKGALLLLNYLPGQIAKQFRAAFTEILTRYFAGDATLHDEIEANASSANPLHVLAREELAADRADELDFDRPRKRVKAAEATKACSAVLHAQNATGAIYAIKNNAVNQTILGFKGTTRKFKKDQGIPDRQSCRDIMTAAQLAMATAMEISIKCLSHKRQQMLKRTLEHQETKAVVTEVCDPFAVLCAKIGIHEQSIAPALKVASARKTLEAAQPALPAV